MDLFSMPLYKAVGNRLEWLNEKQSLTTQNITNVNTPGYAAQDLKEPSFRDLLQGASSKRNTSFKANSKHIPIQSSILKNFKLEKDKSSKSLNGNAVSVEDEILKLNKTAMMDYEMKAILRKNIELMRIALRAR